MAPTKLETMGGKVMATKAKKEKGNTEATELTTEERVAACQAAVNLALAKFNCDVMPVITITNRGVMRTSGCQIFALPDKKQAPPEEKKPEKKNATRK